jgi:carbon storage regulator
MLVISRKPGERVLIGDDVEISILEISGSRVVVGIDAPRSVVIRRADLPRASVEGSEEAGAEVAPAPAVRADVPPAEPPATPVRVGEDAGPSGAVPVGGFDYPKIRLPESAGTPPRRTPTVRVKRSRLRTDS